MGIVSPFMMMVYTTKSRPPMKIAYEEKVYRDIQPFVRLYQGFWLSAMVIFSLMSLLPAFSWHSYVESFPISSQTMIWTLLGLNTVGLAGYLLVALWIGVSVCQMRKWVGVVGLVYCVSALAACACIVLFIAVIGMRSDVHSELSPLLLRFYLIMLSFVIPFSYICWRGMLASRRFAFAEQDTKRIVSELATPLQKRSWFWKVLGIPFPIDRIRKNRPATLTLFTCSGVAFATFTTCAGLAPGFVMAPLLVAPYASGDESYKPDTTWMATLLTVMKYSPLILAVIAASALVIGTKLRSLGRQLSISSILESQQNDSRPPILFLRPFYDDRVALRRPQLSLLGRIVNVMQSKQTLDVLVLEEGTPLGPVVALGNPDDPIPQYGAARGYFSSGEWRASVQQLLDQSAVIIICVDLTEGIQWEIEQIIARGHSHKTLFLVHPGSRDSGKNQSLLQGVVNRIEAQMCTSFDVKAVESHSAIGLFFDGHGQLRVGVSAEFSESSYLLMARWFFRSASRSNLTPSVGANKSE
jgi:hypothetical protein